MNHLIYSRTLILRTFFIFLFVYSCAASAQSAISLAVFPFESQETLVGVAVAERVATALETVQPSEEQEQGEHPVELLGPEVALALVPPLAVQNGFLNPLVFLGQSQSASSRTATALLRDALGVDAALTGRIEFVAGQLELTFNLATARGLYSFSATASEDNPAQLAETVLAVLGQRLELPSAEVKAIDLNSPYGDYIEAVTLLSGGLIAEAQTALERAVEADPRYRALLEAVRAAREGDLTNVQSLPLNAALALSAQPLDETAALRAFQALTERSELGAYQTWSGLLQADAGDDVGAAQAFDTAASYPYGRAARALYNALNEDLNADILTDIEGVAQSESRGGLLGALLAAQQLEDPALETRLATQLSHLAPNLPYSFERLSQLAFDEDRPFDAAQALLVATELEPESDLYWTNLGWAYYLLDRLNVSEEASLRALDLNPDETVAWYNLGLTRAVTGRLGEAMDAYAEALSRDPQVDDAAVEDLENALERYPDTAEVHFALATLYEAEDKSDAAITQFERYLDREEDAPRFVQRAEQRLQVLRAPPAPLEITDGARLSLGPDNLSAETFRPGDRIFPDFELFTPGLELPQEVTLTLQLVDEQGVGVNNASLEERFAIPGDAVALQIDDIGFSLPKGLAPGRYGLEITLSASRERQTSVALPLEVEGEALFVRQLVSQGVLLRSFSSNTSLYDERNLALSNEQLTQRLLAELSENAGAAEEALPEIATGRFEGLSGASLFNQSDAEDIRNFLTFLLAQPSGEGEFRVNFVDAYAQWALEGAPTP